MDSSDTSARRWRSASVLPDKRENSHDSEEKDGGWSPLQFTHTLCSRPGQTAVGMLSCALCNAYQWEVPRLKTVNSSASNQPLILPVSIFFGVVITAHLNMHLDSHPYLWSINPFITSTVSYTQNSFWLTKILALWVCRVGLNLTRRV